MKTTLLSILILACSSFIACSTTGEEPAQTGAQTDLGSLTFSPGLIDKLQSTHQLSLNSIGMAFGCSAATAEVVCMGMKGGDLLSSEITQSILVELDRGAIESAPDHSVIVVLRPVENGQGWTVSVDTESPFMHARKP